MVILYFLTSTSFGNLLENSPLRPQLTEGEKDMGEGIAFFKGLWIVLSINTAILFLKPFSSDDSAF